MYSSEEKRLALWAGAGALALLLLPGGVVALCAGAVLGYRGRGWLESLGKEARG
ncbi:MAG TPA: hypothetical protein H9841_10350 [Candidatus Flavonifractor merdigallinarum]|uniref:Uncharacterized protein n=1 Tax=Candidatus Flavonifractor merdigallinarum TaxID=2838589 RepID=A0A9D1YAE0_9FIRM|nr:hypothetical protein [Candidatus Flavonifractor merdigallinarum]